MILVTLGTQDKKFTRLLNAVQRQIDLGNIKDEVIVQAGFTSDFKSKNMKIIDLISIEEFDKLQDECDILITHGGVGSIIGALKKGKRVIAAARLKKYKEHTNDHQIQIVNNFYEKGYLLKLDDFNDLDIVLKKAKSFKPKEFKSSTINMINIIKKYIDTN